MPYENISDLPTSQVENYSLHQKKAFLEAFNNAFEEYDHDESRAFAVAHHAAQQASKESDND
jgi:cation transport regulator